ncbi:sensor histidine kinase [Spongiivirga citrea]|uniref:histidine kinase n=1 Tax=Spongiivirga citrea TaxID=1481457 RepID=A0A6M0CR38_9FLAO|nr:two-component regulator propeller domain-containing protein [Spongiivirga citrea]NER18329.1 hypothetical protein [Spongiivirga citrea]
MRHLIYPFLFSFFIVFSQEKGIHYTTADGLPHDITYGIYQDTEGYLWIGTDNGLAKFDGQKFKVFTTNEGLRTNYVIDIAQNENGTLGIASWGGGVHLIKNDSVLLPKIPNDSLEKINNIDFHKEMILVENSSGNYVYHKTNGGYHRETLIAKMANDGKYILERPEDFERPNGKIGTLDGKMVLFNGSYFVEFNDEKLYGIYSVDVDRKTTELFPFLNDKIIHSVSKVGLNEFVASQRDTVYFFNRESIEHTEVIPTGGRIIKKIIKTRDNEYLLLTKGGNGFKRAFHYNLVKDTTVDLSIGLSISAPISDILKDHEGNVWLTTHGDGVYCVINQDVDFTYLDDSHLRDATNIKGIVELNGEIFVLTANHLFSFRNFEKESEINLKGMGKHLLKLDGDKISINFLGKGSNSGHPFLIENQSYKSFMVDSLDYIIQADSLKIPSLKTKAIYENRILFDAVFFRDTLWFATSTGPSYYDYKTNSLINKTINGKTLSSKQIKKFLKQNDSLWIATTKGLDLLFENRLKSFTTKNGLIDNQVNTLLIDHRKDLWIGTQKGISILKENKCVNITEATGLLSPYVETLLEDSDHNIWIGGNKGVTIINNKTRLKLQSPPRLIIEQMKNSFSYNVISYNRSNSLVTEYQIDNETWTRVLEKKGVLDFSKLGTGDHSFKLRAKKQDGAWKYSKSYTFSVTLPWQKDWRYILLLTSIVFIGVITIVSKQLQKTKQRNKSLQLTIERKEELEKELSNVRENVARDFHDDLGNRLARISIFSNLLSANNNDIDEGDQELIGQINTDADYLYKGTRDFIFSLKSESDYLEEVITYLSDFGEDYFRQFNIDFVVNKRIAKNTKLPYYWSKQLIFIFKEAMTNVAKHAKCSKIELSFSFKSDRLIIKCEDNGIGIHEELLGSSRGINNMKRRANKIGGELLIHSLKEKGTSVTFNGKTTLVV